jgi:uncharacterized protein
MKRIPLIDILRGFAILGTLGTNIWIFANLGNTESVFPDEPWWNSFDSFLHMLVLFLANGKFLGMLTILFGVGLEIKYRISLKKGQTWPGLYIWSSFLLILDGFLHYLFVLEFDILMSYGITAIIVAYCVKNGVPAMKKAMWISGIIHILFLLLIVTANPKIDDIAVDPSTQIYLTGTWFEQIQYRLEMFLPFRFETFFIIPMNIFLFLSGVFFIRSGAFADDPNGKRIRQKFLWWGIGLGLPLNLIVFIPTISAQLLVRYLFAPLLSLGYIAVIALMTEKGHFQWLWKRTEELGKTSLSCYLLQNIIASFLFYGWGLGLGGQFSSIFTILSWLLISLMLMFFAHYWLRYFKMGPFEALWRWSAQLPTRIGKKTQQT